MKKEVKHSGIGINLMLLVTVLFGSLFSSCYTKDDVPVVPPTVSTDPATYTVNVTVTSDKGALEGVSVYPMGLTTDASGKCTYTQTGSGIVIFSLVKEGYVNAFYAVTLPTAGSGEKVTLAATFFMKAEKKAEEEVPAVYNILGKVFDGVTKAPIEGATVTGTLRGDADVVLEEQTTDAEGNFSYANVEKTGVYDIVIKKAGMNDVRYAATIQQVPAGQEYNFNLEVPMYTEGSVEGKFYTLNCFIVTPEGEPFTGNVSVTYRNNDDPAVKMEVTAGDFLIPNLKAGTVSVIVKVDDATLEYNAYSAKYDLSAFNEGTVIGLPVYLTKRKAGNVAEVVTPEEEVTIDVPELEEDMSAETPSVAVKTELFVPQGALKTEEVISVKVSGVIENAVVSEESAPITDETPATATFVTGEFLPTGLTFEKPLVWTVANPVGTSTGETKHAFDKLQLQYSEDGIVWKDVDNEVTYDKATGKYSTKIEHFSSYRMVVTSTVDTSSMWKTLSVGNFVNNTGKPIAAGKGEFKYNDYEGYEYEITVDEALRIANITSDKIKVMLQKAVEMKGEVGIKEVAKTGTNDIEVIPGWVYVATGKQQFVTKTYTFEIDGKKVKVVIREAKAVILKGSSEIYDQHHTHGGHITEGGAGGGAGE